MKKEELRKDPVAEKIVRGIKYAKDNILFMLLGLSVVVAAVMGVTHLKVTNDEYEINSKLAVDEIMIQLINKGLNDADYFDRTLSNQIDSIYKIYPESEYISYLVFILNKENSGSEDIIDKVNLMKKNIDNKWFKTQAFLISGDYYADNKELKLAMSDYKNAIKHSQSNTQKGYSNYKLGNIYFELNDLKNALSSFEKAQVFLATSNKNSGVNRNQQFSSWIDRNDIALYKVKSMLKK
mgnify:CR=1 FL=1